VETYILKRILLMVPTVFIVITVVFFALHLAPGDPINMLIPPDVGVGAAREALIARIKAEYGFDQPLYIQYFRYLARTASLDFGRSLRNKTPIVDDLARRLPNTLQLGFLALLISVTLGVGFGVVSAVRRESVFDNLTMFGALFGVSMPSFWFGFMLMLLFGIYWALLPPSGYDGPIWTWIGFKHAILPAVTLGVGSTAVMARFTRSSMLEVINQDYIRTARAKGLSERVVIFRHALKNALIPVITLLGIRFGALLAGSVIIETVFAWPGVGRYMIAGITSRDFPMVQGTVLVVTLGFVSANFLTDLAYAYIDPRIRYE
jgi:peptide/nickel transport system permease protein